MEYDQQQILNSITVELSWEKTQHSFFPNVNQKIELENDVLAVDHKSLRKECTVSFFFKNNQKIALSTSILVLQPTMELGSVIYERL